MTKAKGKAKAKPKPTRHPDHGKHLHTTGRLHVDTRAHKLIAEPGDDEDMLNTSAMAEWLGVSVSWLMIGRSKGYGPPYHCLGNSVIRYNRGEGREWLKTRMHLRTSEYMPERRAAATAAPAASSPRRVQENV